MPALKYSRQRESIKENLMNRFDHPPLTWYILTSGRFIPISASEPYTVICPCSQIWERSGSW